MRLTDGIKTVEIKMVTWENSGYSPDWAADFFEAGRLPYDADTDTHEVDDVDDCIKEARDWEAGRGDYEPGEFENVGNRKVFID